MSNHWGFDRGTPVDRFYIEQFLSQNARDVSGNVLEVQDSTYSVRYGRDSVRRYDVLDIDENNSQATLVADLAAADSVPAATFDCFILTQTLHLIFDVRAAIQHAHRVLAPGGVLLATVPAVSRMVRGPLLEADYWRFTLASCAKLFGEAFGDEQIRLQSYGNTLTCSAFLMGMSAEELRPSELRFHDLRFPLVLAVRAVKPLT